MARLAAITLPPKALPACSKSSAFLNGSTARQEPLAFGTIAGGRYLPRFWRGSAMLVKLDADLSVIFGTQLFLRKQFLDPVTNAGLEKAVRARAAAQPGVKVSNTGGWQSEPDLFDWQE